MHESDFKKPGACWHAPGLNNFIQDFDCGQRSEYTAYANATPLFIQSKHTLVAVPFTFCVVTLKVSQVCVYAMHIKVRELIMMSNYFLKCQNIVNFIPSNQLWKMHCIVHFWCDFFGWIATEVRSVVHLN